MQLLPFIIRAIPTVLTVALELFKMYKEEKDKKKKKELIKEFKEGIKDARVTKDTSRLERVFNHGFDHERLQDDDKKIT